MAAPELLDNIGDLPEEIPEFVPEGYNLPKPQVKETPDPEEAAEPVAAGDGPDPLDVLALVLLGVFVAAVTIGGFLFSAIAGFGALGLSALLTVVLIALADRDTGSAARVQGRLDAVEAVVDGALVAFSTGSRRVITETRHTGRTR